MKKNQSGISSLGLLVAILAMVLVSFIGWFIYSNQNDNKASNPSAGQMDTSLQSQSSTEPEDWIEVANADDVNNMPSNVPQSFKNYMLVEIEKATSGKDNTYCDEGRKTSFAFYNISAVNIRGTFGPTSSGSGPCGGKTIWVLNPLGSWDMIPYPSSPCMSANGGKIYEEYLDECIDSKGDWIKNPNGSIKSLAN